MASVKYGAALLCILSLFLGTSFADMQSDFVSAHNSARDAVGVPGLEWSSEVAAYAQRWAETLSGSCSLQHSQNGPYGENLWMWSGSDGLAAPSPKDAVQSWVNEKVDYNYNSNSCAQDKVCGHYTQVVWRNSKSVGCAFVKCNGRNAYIASCNYSPPGNYVGEKPY